MEVSFGVGFKVEANATVGGVEIGAELGYAEKDSIVVDDGITEVKHITELSASASVLFLDTTVSSTKEHSLTNNECGCNVFTDILTKSSCPAHKTQPTNTSQSMSFSMGLGLYYGVGGSVSFGINLTELFDRLIEIYSD